MTLRETRRACSPTPFPLADPLPPTRCVAVKPLVCALPELMRAARNCRPAAIILFQSARAEPSPVSVEKGQTTPLSSTLTGSTQTILPRAVFAHMPLVCRTAFTARRSSPRAAQHTSPRALAQQLPFLLDFVAFATAPDTPI